MKKINLHAHSLWSDGSGTIAEMTREYERLGFVVSVITDHDYMMKNKDVIQQQRGEIQRLNAAGMFAIPIIQGCEITLCYEEEAVLFGEEAIDHWFSKRPPRVYVPGMFDDFEHALIWAHPRLHSKYCVCKDIQFLTKFHGFEIENSGKSVFGENHEKNNMNRLDRIKEYIKYEPYRNSDAHSVRMIELSYNEIDRDIEDERALIAWIKLRGI